MRFSLDVCEPFNVQIKDFRLHRCGKRVCSLCVQAPLHEAIITKSYHGTLMKTGQGREVSEEKSKCDYT